MLLGRAQLGARQTEKAIESFKSALEANPKSFEAEFYLGTAYEQSGNSAEAVKIFARLLEQTRKPLGRILGRAESQSGRVPAASGLVVSGHGGI